MVEFASEALFTFREGLCCLSPSYLHPLIRSFPFGAYILLACAACAVAEDASFESADRRSAHLAQTTSRALAEDLLANFEIHVRILKKRKVRSAPQNCSSSSGRGISHFDGCARALSGDYLVSAGAILEIRFDSLEGNLIKGRK